MENIEKVIALYKYIKESVIVILMEFDFLREHYKDMPRTIL